MVGWNKYWRYIVFSSKENIVVTFYLSFHNKSSAKDAQSFSYLIQYEDNVIFMLKHESSNLNYPWVIQMNDSYIDEW